MQLVGALIGLAIYNSVLLDVHFPLALYKKLQGLPVGLDDLAELAPTVAQSLRALLDYKGACTASTIARCITLQLSMSACASLCKCMITRSCTITLQLAL